MFLLGNLSDITVNKTTQRPFVLRASLTAQKIVPLPVENIYNKLKYCEWHVRDRVRCRIYTVLKTFLDSVGFQRGSLYLCVNKHKDPCGKK